MQYTAIEPKIQKRLDELLKNYQVVLSIAQDLHQHNGAALIVGGAVRDLLLGNDVKDIDIEVHGLSLEQLEKILNNYGVVSLVGKSFGVLRIHGLDIDWSIPRSDKPGRKPEVSLDPFMTYKEAFRRRDLTINAMGINILTKELIDPFNGYQDLNNKILRATDQILFLEDPLRFYRVMQFLARFEMKPDEALNTLCATMDISGVSKERIEAEFTKWLLKSKRPSLSLDWLNSIGRLKKIMPEIAATKGVEQRADWHPEGDVFEHTKQTIDAAAALEYSSNQEKLTVMYAALCHDIGKPLVTEEKEGILISHGHAEIGAELTKKMLKRITNNVQLIHDVALLVDCHMHPAQFVKSNAGLAAYRRLAKKLAPDLTLNMLAKLMLADRQGRNPQRGKPLTTIDDDVKVFIKRSEEAHVLHGAQEPILHGRDIEDIVKPGPEMGKLLKEAYTMQIEEGITDKELLKKRLTIRLKSSR